MDRQWAFKEKSERNRAIFRCDPVEMLTFANISGIRTAPLQKVPRIRAEQPLMILRSGRIVRIGLRSPGNGARIPFCLQISARAADRPSTSCQQSDLIKRFPGVSGNEKIVFRRKKQSV